MSTKLILFIFKPQKRLHCSTKSEVKKNWILTDYIFNFFLEMSLSQLWYKITKKCNDVIRDKSEIFLHWYPLFQLLIGNLEIPNELATTHLHLLASRLVLLSLNIISNRQRIGDEIKLMVIMCGSKIFEHLQMKYIY